MKLSSLICAVALMVGASGAYAQDHGGKDHGKGKAGKHAGKKKKKEEKKDAAAGGDAAGGGAAHGTDHAPAGDAGAGDGEGM